MEVTAKSVQECSRGKEENAVAPLCTTMKDHHNSFLQRKVDVHFGEEHNAAMNARLRKFYFKSLNSRPVPGVQQSLRDSAMDCIVWASKVVRTPDDELPPPMPGSVAKPNELDEGEKDRIKTMSLEDSERHANATIKIFSLFSSSSSQTPTQKSTSQNVSQRGKSRKRPSQTSTPVPKKGRITNFFKPKQQ